MTRAHSSAGSRWTGPPPATPGRVDQPVDGAAEGDRVLHELGHRGLVGHVGVAEGPAPPGVGPLRCGVRRRREVGPHDRRPLLEQAGRRGPADARCRAGDDVGPPSQSTHGSSPLVAPGRPGLIGAVHCLARAVPGPPSSGGSPRHEVRAVLRNPRPPPLGGRQRARRLPEHAGAGDRRRPLRVARLLDGRAPLPAGVLPLLEPRGALRRHRGADRAHPPRLRRAPHAQALQPPGAHRGVGGRARPALGRPGRPRDGPLGDPGRARGLRHRPGREPAHVAGGHRARRRLLDQRGVRVRGRVLADAPAARAAQALAEAAPAAVGRHDQRRGPRPGRRPRPRPVLVRRGPAAGGGQAQDRHLPRRRRALRHAHRRLRAQPGGDVHHGHLRARPRRGDRRGAGVLRVVPQDGRPPDRHADRLDGRAQRGVWAATPTPPT